MKILVTTVSTPHAEMLVRTLVDERHVACANILPEVSSIYRWQGETCHESETLLVMETSDERCAAAFARLRAIHPYECPKIVVLQPIEVFEAYARWVDESTA